MPQYGIEIGKYIHTLKAYPTLEHEMESKIEFDIDLKPKTLSSLGLDFPT